MPETRTSRAECPRPLGRGHRIAQVLLVPNRTGGRLCVQARSERVAMQHVLEQEAIRHENALRYYVNLRRGKEHSDG